MKQCVLREPGLLVVEEVCDPQPGPRDVVIRVRTALTCGTDLKAYRRGHPKMPCPTPFGHEYAGDVVAAGAEVAGFRVGDALMAANTGPCGRCFFCLADQENLCETIMDEMVLGAYAEYLLVPDRVLRSNAFVKPEALSYEQATLLEPLSAVCFGLTHLSLRTIREGTVVLIGAGAISMLWLAALKSHGARSVVVAGRREPRLAAAREAGADITVGEGGDVRAAIDELTEGRGADAVIECIGQPEVWAAASGYARSGGTVVLFGGCAAGSKVELDTYRLHYDGVRVVSPFHFRPRDVAESRRLLLTDGERFRGLITSRVALEDLPGVFAEWGENSGMKCAVYPAGLTDPAATGERS